MIIKINQKKEKSVEKKEKFWSNQYLKFPKTFFLLHGV